MWGTRAQTQQNGAVHETGPGTWYLGIDLGTGGLKVGAVDLAGKVLASAFGSIDTVNTEDGGNEQDPFVWFDALVSAGREITTALRGGGHQPRNMPGDRHHWPMGFDDPGRRCREAGRPVSAVVGPSRRTMVSQADRRQHRRGGIRREEDRQLAAFRRGCTVEGRCRSDGAHAVPPPPPARDRLAHRLSSRTGRPHRRVADRRRGGDSGVDGAVVAHRQPTRCSVCISSGAATARRPARFAASAASPDRFACRRPLTGARNRVGPCCSRRHDRCAGGVWPAGSAYCGDRHRRPGLLRRPSHDLNKRMGLGAGQLQERPQ